MAETRGTARGFLPSSRVGGSFRPGGSKSIAQRALLAAAACAEPTTLTGVPEGADVARALALLEACGAEVVRTAPGRVRITGGLERLRPGGPVTAGESGTLARLSTALLALATRPGTRWTIRAEGSLLRRRSAPLFAALERAGVRLDAQESPGGWPVELAAAAAPHALELERPVSSQEVTALLLAQAAAGGRRTLTVRGTIPSLSYLRISRGVLLAFGVPTRIESDEPGGQAWVVEGPLRASAEPFAVEPDASSAAVALAAACLSGGELDVPGIGRDSWQGDVHIVEHLAALGCDARRDEHGLHARGFPARGAELDLSGEPDLAPVLAALAAGAALRHGATSVLSGLGTLRGKESDRITVLGTGLARLGLAAETGTDFLRVAPGKPARAPLVLDPHGDHRMAFAFALLGLLRADVLVRDPACVAKSWPAFWEDLAAVGAIPVR